MIIKLFSSLSMLVLLLPAAVSAQMKELETLASWVALDAPTGHEHLATGPLMAGLDGWSVDNSGNMSKTTGSGNPHRVVACALDAHSFAVSQITSDGYLRLHHIARAPTHPLWAQSHEGQQVRILTRKGPLVGVTAASNGHFSNLHKNETALVRADDLWLDVGATSASDVADMGIALLDPVVRHIPAWSYGNEIAGPGAGARVGCAAVVAGAEKSIASKGRITWVLTTQSAFNWVGLGSAIASLAPVDELILLGRGESDRRSESVSGITRRVDSVLAYAGVAKIHRLSPKVSDAGALMERIEAAEARHLLREMQTLVGDVGNRPEWIEAPATERVVNGQAQRLSAGPKAKEHSEIEQLLDRLAEISAVPGHEGPIRAIVEDALPAWAKNIAQTDDMGNFWVDMGPKDGKATVFIAHMDEVGFEVETIDTSGIVHLKRLGGAVSSAWEGQPALLQLDAARGINSASSVANLKGVFLVRTKPSEKNPSSIKAWFGMDAKDLAAAGVKAGMGVTGYKEGHRMGRTRYAARSLDDRVGTTAMVKALQAMDPAKLEHRVIFAWSVREEGGLFGATALAERFGMVTRRVYSVDTFVSSDTPLESPHFAYTPLGSGPVLRSIENSGMARPEELDRNRAVAKSAGITVQVGLTQGGTDGTAFTYWGAPNAGLSWPGRYSHGPAEIADLSDVADLVTLIGAMAHAAP